jgi:hypothetical protein
MSIKLNFIPFEQQNFEFIIFRRLHDSVEFSDTSMYYDLPDDNKSINWKKYEVTFEYEDGFEKFKLEPYTSTPLIAKIIFDRLISALPINSYFIKKESISNRKIHYILSKEVKGKKCIWIEPYYLKSKQLWGILFDYAFVVNVNEDDNQKFKLDKDILIASGTLDKRGASNVDYYLFKHNYYERFLNSVLPSINSVLTNKISVELFDIESRLLNTKTYVFGNNVTSNSPYLGLTRNPPLQKIPDQVIFYFIYKIQDRDIAVSLLKGLRGELSPVTFSGMSKLFSLPFNNQVIKGSAISEFSEEVIGNEINSIKSLGQTVIPIIITNSKRNEEDERLYYWLKHKFTNEKIPCQIVTKELVKNEYSLKYSLSNIGLQIFAKAGGKPWKMKPATNECLIIGIGQSYNIEKTDDGNTIEKNLTYSVLTDSSGLFKDIHVIGEGVETDETYYTQLITNISNIISNSGFKKVSIHVPFRISKEKILDKVVNIINKDVELSVLVINSKNDYFGYNYDNNGLVPFESTYIKLAHDEFLVWFEGLQYNNPKISKRYGNPLLIKFWYFNKEDLSHDYDFKERLLQDCINLSGANWRGFKAKQLPVSVFYCQRIADFIAKFHQYHFNHIEIDNLKPWFL